MPTSIHDDVASKKIKHSPKNNEIKNGYKIGMESFFSLALIPEFYDDSR
jgi:hypothetical protein